MASVTTGKIRLHKARKHLEDACQSGRLAEGRFDGLRARLAANRSVFIGTLPGAVLRFQPPRREKLRGDHRKLVAPGHDGGAKAHYDGIVAFSQTDFTEDLKKISVPVLVMHCDDDQDRPVERDMNCLVCSANAETIETTVEVVSLVCPRCCEYDVSHSVIAAGQLLQLQPKQRRDILDKAKRSAPLGARPLIRPYLLA